MHFPAIEQLFELRDVEVGSEPEASDESQGELYEVTHAFTCSVCFDDLILHSIARTLGSRELCPHFQATPENTPLTCLTS